MTIKTVYIAEDGTSFNTEQACKDYENRSNLTTNNEIKWFDKFLQPLEKKPTNWNRLRFMRFKDSDADQFFHDYVSYHKDWICVANSIKFEDYSDMALLVNYNSYIYWNGERWIDLGKSVKD